MNLEGYHRIKEVFDDYGVVINPSPRGEKIDARFVVIQLTGFRHQEHIAVPDPSFTPAEALNALDNAGLMAQQSGEPVDLSLPQLALRNVYMAPEPPYKTLQPHIVFEDLAAGQSRSERPV